MSQFVGVFLLVCMSPWFVLGFVQLYEYLSLRKLRRRKMELEVQKLIGDVHRS